MSKSRQNRTLSIHNRRRALREVL